MDNPLVICLPNHAIKRDGKEDVATRSTGPDPRLAQRGTARPRAQSHSGTNYVARFTAPEFTTLCKITGQPDFAHLVIDYVPGKFLLESKSLKLYLFSFRNHDAFHEDCTVAIGKRLYEFLKPKWLRIGGYWYPRGGIPIDVFWQAGKLPKDVWLPDQGVAPTAGAARLPKLPVCAATKHRPSR